MKMDPFYNDTEYLNSVRLSGEEPLVLVHTNKLCIISLSPNHPIVLNKLQVSKVVYEVPDANLLEEEDGKRKLAQKGHFLTTRSALCTIHTKDGGSFSVKCGSRGKLV